MDPFYLSYMHDVEYAPSYTFGSQMVEVTVHYRDQNRQVSSTGPVQDMMPIPFRLGSEAIVMFYGMYGRAYIQFHLPKNPQTREWDDMFPVDVIRLAHTDDFYSHQRNTSKEVNIEQCALLDLAQQLRQRQLFVMGVIDDR